MGKSAIGAVCVLVCFVVGPAFAGTVTQDIDPHKSMYFATVRNDHSVESHYLTDTDGDGKIQITIPNQDTVREYWITKPLNGRLLRYTVKSLSAILESLEPFVLPLFEAVTPGVSLFVEYSVDSTVDFGSVFTTGDDIAATSGTIPTTSLITIRDASSLPSVLESTLYDPSTLDLYSGDLQVTTFDAFDPPVVPLPAAAWLAALGMGVASAASRWRRRETR